MNIKNENLNISPMTVEDIPFTLSMTDIERWGYLEADFRRLISFEPEGCFIARLDREPVGMITSTSFKHFAFVGMLIVKKDLRNRHIGEALMEKVINYLERKGVTTIELDGVIPALALYRRLGFKDKYLSLRFVRPPVSERSAKTLLPVATEKVIEFDNEMIRYDRERIVKRYLGDFEDSIFVYPDENNLKAYAVLRKRADGSYYVGPLVAESYFAAKKLLHWITQAYPERVLRIGVPALNRAFVNALVDRGFLYNQPTLRMYRGKKFDYEKHIYGIMSPDKG